MNPPAAGRGGERTVLRRRDGLGVMRYLIVNGEDPGSLRLRPAGRVEQAPPHSGQVAGSQHQHNDGHGQSDNTGHQEDRGQEAAHKAHGPEHGQHVAAVRLNILRRAG
jgi:hypothetical protein